MRDLKDIHEHQDQYQLVDVREPYEWEAGRIDGAIHIPLSQLMSGTEEGTLDPSKPVIVVCRSGNRSELGATMLKARGFDARNMEGGMEDWAREGLPVTGPDGGPGRVA